MSTNPEDMENELKELRARVLKLECDGDSRRPPPAKDTLDFTDREAWMKASCGEAISPTRFECFMSGRQTMRKEIAALIVDAKAVWYSSLARDRLLSAAGIDPESIPGKHVVDLGGH